MQLRRQQRSDVEAIDVRGVVGRHASDDEVLHVLEPIPKDVESDESFVIPYVAPNREQEVPHVEA